MNQLSLSDLIEYFLVEEVHPTRRSRRPLSYLLHQDVLYKLSKALVVGAVSDTDKNRVGPSIQREETRLESLSDFSQEQDRREETQSVLLGHN